ncbi:MAG TPA: IPT/TIG domain-containing protein, partial [Chitinophagaceae bacterium]|nr:IPT/TIG domain-containing protein [Chitinophagaceae bacterium]
MHTILIQHGKKGLFLLLMIAGLLQVSCKKDNNSGGPSIRQIRAISPKPNDSTLTAALPGQIVVIQGAHLATTSQILFDGFHATVNSALFSDSTLVITVPTIAWDSIPAGKLNTVDVVTAYGTTTYKFTITPPLPVIT